MRCEAFRKFIGALHERKYDYTVIKTSNATSSEEVNVFDSIKINNIKYNIKNVLQINDTEFDTLLEFGLLLYILLDKKNITFILFLLTIISFKIICRLQILIKDEDAQCLLIQWDNLTNKFLYNIHIMGDGKNYIVPL